MFGPKFSQYFEHLTVRNDNLFVKLFLKTIIYFHKLSGIGMYLQLEIPNLFEYGSTILRPFRGVPR